jgi:hypothetical protein
MTTTKYALLSNGKYVKSYSYDDVKLTDDIDKAKLLTLRGFTEFTIMACVQHGYEMVEVKSTRAEAGKPTPVSNMLQQRLDVLQKEFDLLDVVMEKDIEELADKDFRRWKRLKRVLKEKDISGLAG